MSLKDYCDRIIKPSYVEEEEAANDLTLDPLGEYLTEPGTQDIADELTDILNSNTETDTTNSTVLDGDETGNRLAERILVSRQEIRRTAYVQQLIKDAKNAIKKISNLKVDFDNYNLAEAQDAINILNGRENEVLAKLRNTLENQLDSQKDIDYYLNYVKSLL